MSSARTSTLINENYEVIWKPVRDPSKKPWTKAAAILRFTGASKGVARFQIDKNWYADPPSGSEYYNHWPWLRQLIVDAPSARVVARATKTGFRPMIIMNYADMAMLRLSHDEGDGPVDG